MMAARSREHTSCAPECKCCLEEDRPRRVKRMGRADYLEATSGIEPEYTDLQSAA